MRLRSSNKHAREQHHIAATVGSKRTPRSTLLDDDDDPLPTPEIPTRTSRAPLLLNGDSKLRQRNAMQPTTHSNTQHTLHHVLRAQPDSIHAPMRFTCG